MSRCRQGQVADMRKEAAAAPGDPGADVQEAVAAFPGFGSREFADPAGRSVRVADALPGPDGKPAAVRTGPPISSRGGLTWRPAGSRHPTDRGRVAQ